MFTYTLSTEDYSFLVQSLTAYQRAGELNMARYSPMFNAAALGVPNWVAENCFAAQKDCFYFTSKQFNGETQNVKVVLTAAHRKGNEIVCALGLLITTRKGQDASGKWEYAELFSTRSGYKTPEEMIDLLKISDDSLANRILNWAEDNADLPWNEKRDLTLKPCGDRPLITFRFAVNIDPSTKQSKEDKGLPSKDKYLRLNDWFISQFAPSAGRSDLNEELHDEVAALAYGQEAVAPAPQAGPRGL